MKTQNQELSSAPVLSKVVDWLMSYNNCETSRLLYRVLTGEVSAANLDIRDFPATYSAFKNCYCLTRDVPELGSMLYKMRAVPGWDQLLEGWDELGQIVERDMANDASRELTRRLGAIKHMAEYGVDLGAMPSVFTCYLPEEDDSLEAASKGKVLTHLRACYSRTILDDNKVILVINNDNLQPIDTDGVVGDTQLRLVAKLGFTVISKKDYPLNVKIGERTICINNACDARIFSSETPARKSAPVRAL